MVKPVFARKLIWAASFVGIITIGLWIRLIDLDDPPLDFNPTRQLRSAIIARGFYYERSTALDPNTRALAISHKDSMENLEPPILESIVAWSYQLLDGENLEVARIFSSLFWIAGGIALWDLGRRISSSMGALAGVGYYLFLPFSILASRSFQPDPGMVMLILWTAWALYQWMEKRSWKWLVLTGLLGGVAGLVKIMALFFTFGMVMGAFLYYAKETFLSSSQVPKSRWRVLSNLIALPQFWTIILLMILPALGYYLLGNRDGSSSFLTQWTLFTRWREVTDPSFFMRWMIRIDDLLMIGLILAGFSGTLLTSPKNRALLWGIWVGYLAFGVTFPYHTLTHDYYHLPLVVVVSLSLIPLVSLIWKMVVDRGRLLSLTFIGVLVLFFVYNAWIGRSILVGQNFRQHPAFWREVSESMPVGAKVIGVTQDYGFRLMYYGWRKIAIWPQGAGSEDFENRHQDAAYFLITAKNQIRQEMLDYLEENFPKVAFGEGYLVYDLQP